MKYVIANFKSNLNRAAIQSWLTDFVQNAPETNLTSILALPFPYLSLASGIAKLRLGAQNVSSFPMGSYTGEVNASQLLDLGVSYCLVGHSERRQYCGESNLDVTKKVSELLAINITPVVCLDETNLAAQLALFDPQTITQCLFAFEPPGDIGGTVLPPLTMIESQLTTIRSLTHSSSLGVLYGGSVTPANCHSLESLADGLLIGSASLDVKDFLAILRKLS